MLDNLDNGNCNERNLRRTSRALWILFNARKDRPRRKKRMLSGNKKTLRTKLKTSFCSNLFLNSSQLITVIILINSILFKNTTRIIKNFNWFFKMQFRHFYIDISVIKLKRFIAGMGFLINTKSKEVDNHSSFNWLLAEKNI